ncbi:immunoglobulin superfamily member 3-like isoform X2 [Mobula birostris]|uniref:immunoglobulin superfamily member 3-like isoform X2 n=1 Tax=Mobula birostris TaxID=1983395 RepID=UPI003B28882C
MKFSSSVVPICLLLIKGLLVRGGIHQSPALLKVPAGASVELGCLFDEPAVAPTVAAFQWDLPNGRLYHVLPAGRVGGSTSWRVHLQAELKARSSRLSISRVSSADSGLYVCVVQLLEPLPIVQMKGTATRLHIIPESTPVPGWVSQSPASLSAREGEPVTLTCILQTTATEAEEMSFIWMWGTSLTTCSTVPGATSRWQCAPVPDPGVLITADLQTKSSEFSITQVSLDHNGTYKCDVAITKPLARVILHGNGSTLLVEESPLTVSQLPSLITVMEGEDARLTCSLQQEAADVRNLSFTWSSESAEVTCPIVVPGQESNWCSSWDGRLSVMAHGWNKSSVLTIKEVSVVDNGTYRCGVTLLDPPGDKTVYGNGSVLLVLGEVESPGTNKSEDLHLLPVNTHREMPKRRMEPWFFISLLCTVGVSLTAGLIFSYCIARRTRATDAGSSRECCGKTATSSASVAVSHGEIPSLVRGLSWCTESQSGIAQFCKGKTAQE